MVENSEAGDIVRIEGIGGEVDSSWSNVGGSIHEFTLASSNIVGSTVIIPLGYTNPTELTTNEITKV